MPFRIFFMARGLGGAEARRLSAELAENHPWLDFSDEISETIGEDLLASDEGLSWRTVASAAELVSWYNSEVRRRRRGGRQDVVEANDAYSDLCKVISGFGKEDAFGEGDFWVVSDSFSGPNPAIISFRSTPLPAGLPGALLEWKQRHPNIESVSVLDEDGEPKLRV